MNDQRFYEEEEVEEFYDEDEIKAELEALDAEENLHHMDEAREHWAEMRKLDAMKKTKRCHCGEPIFEYQFQCGICERERYEDE